MTELTQQADTSRANPRPFASSFRVAIIVAAVEAIALFLIVVLADRAEGSGYIVGRIFGRLLPGALLAALIAGFAARRSRKAWSWRRYAAVIGPVALVFLFLAAAGHYNREWTDADRAEFLRTVEATGIDRELARCMLGEVETAHPHPREVLELEDDELAVLVTVAVTACGGLEE